MIFLLMGLLMFMSPMGRDYPEDPEYQSQADQCGGGWLLGPASACHYAHDVRVMKGDVAKWLARLDGQGRPMRREQKNNQENYFSQAANQEGSVQFRFKERIARDGQAGIDLVVLTMRLAHQAAWEKITARILHEARRGAGGRDSVYALPVDYVVAQLSDAKGGFHAHLHPAKNGVLVGVDGRYGTPTQETGELTFALAEEAFLFYQAKLVEYAKSIMGLDLVLNERGLAVDPTVPMLTWRDAGIGDRHEEAIQRVMEQGKPATGWPMLRATIETRPEEKLTCNYLELARGRWADDVAFARDRHRERAGHDLPTPAAELGMKPKEVFALRAKSHEQHRMWAAETFAHRSDLQRDVVRLSTEMEEIAPAAEKAAGPAWKEELKSVLYMASVSNQGGAVGPEGPGAWVEGDPTPGSLARPGRPTREEVAALRAAMRGPDEGRSRAQADRSAEEALGRGRLAGPAEGAGRWVGAGPAEAPALEEGERDKSWQKGGPKAELVVYEAGRGRGAGGRAEEEKGDASWTNPNPGEGARRSFRDRIAEAVERKVREVEAVMKYRRAPGSEDRAIASAEDFARLKAQASPAPLWFAHMKAFDALKGVQLSPSRWPVQALDVMEGAFEANRLPTYRPDKLTKIDVSKEAWGALSNGDKEWLARLGRRSGCHVRVEGVNVADLTREIKYGPSKSRDVERRQSR